MKDSFVYRVFASCKFALQIGWKINRKRVIMELLQWVFVYIDWLVVSCVLIRFILDMAMKRTSFGKMMLYVWSVVALEALLEIFSRFFETYVKPITDVELYAGINKMLYDKACQVDMLCFEDSEFYNEYMMAVSQAHIKLPDTLQGACQIVARFVAMIGATVIIYQIDRFAILFTIFPILGNFVFYGILNSRIFRMEKENIVFQRMADYVNRTIHLGEYAKEIRMTNVFRLLKKQYDRAVNAIQKVIGRYSIGNMILFWLFQYFTFTLLQEGAVLYAGYRVLVSGTMAFAQMAVIQTTMNSNTWTLIGFADSVMTVVKNGLYLEQTRNFLEYEPAIPEDQDGLIPELPIRSVEFEHVSFGYKKRAEADFQSNRGSVYVLKDINFKIEGNQSVALAGYNGAGKSTLMKLLMRLYDPDEGRILVNGIDIREYQVKAYRELFATAFQNGRIFADTIEENILMGRHTEEDKDKEKVRRALKLADMYEEVENQPLREKTILTREFSKEGVVFSGGQNQKILAARAFAKESPIAVFDEPSSALDPIAEYQLFENIREYGKDRMLFFISHRLSSVRDANIVFYMKNGRIQERGSHGELMSRNGEYASLYRLQAENYQF
ncbi:MAG: ABC transporter ATP-binding protein/permease [Lachnospiraceae bacterium]|nr:ABC transporter ATP-binding protein/permease [Lachnospiraceae bacterium]